MLNRIRTTTSDIGDTLFDEMDIMFNSTISPTCDIDDTLLDEIDIMFNNTKTTNEDDISNIITELISPENIPFVLDNSLFSIEIENLELLFSEDSLYSSPQKDFLNIENP